MSVEMAFTVTGMGATAALVSIVSQYLNTYFDKKVTDSTETLDQKIEKLTESLAHASHAVSDIETEISSRKLLVEELQKDAARHKAILELEPEKVKAISSALTEGVAKQNNKKFWLGVVINIVLFLTGAGFSYFLTTTGQFT